MTTDEILAKQRELSDEIADITNVGDSNEEADPLSSLLMHYFVLGMQMDLFLRNGAPLPTEWASATR